MHSTYIQETLDWLIQNNKLYKTIEIDELLLQELDINANMSTEEIDAIVAEQLQNPSFKPTDNMNDNFDQINYVFVSVPDGDTLVDALPVCTFKCSLF